MRKVEINPGICGLITKAQAEMNDDDELIIKVDTMCDNVRGMMDELGDTYDAYELCLRKPGQGPFFDYAQEHFPVHVSCPAICGIIKAAEVEAGLALARDASIKFVEG